MKKSKLILIFSVVILVCVGIIGCGPSLVMVVERPIKVFSGPKCLFDEGFEEIATLDKGDNVRILGETALKSCLVYKVKLSDGRVGYIPLHADHFKVIEVKK